MFIYAIANGSNLFQFAARNADSLGEDASAVSILRFGEQTLSHALTVLGGRPEYRAQIRKSRDAILELLRTR